LEQTVFIHTKAEKQRFSAEGLSWSQNLKFEIFMSLISRPYLNKLHQRGCQMCIIIFLHSTHHIQDLRRCHYFVKLPTICPLYFTSCAQLIFINVCPKLKPKQMQQCSYFLQWTPESQPKFLSKLINTVVTPWFVSRYSKSVRPSLQKKTNLSINPPFKSEGS